MCLIKIYFESEEAIKTFLDKQKWREFINRLALQKMLKVALLPTQKGKSTQNFMIINRKIKLQLHIRIGFKTFYYKIKVKEK